MGTIGALRKLNGFHGAQVFFTGGYVRDFLRRKKNKDVDIIVRNLGALQVRKFLNSYGRTKSVSLAFDIPIILFRAFRDDLEAQITFPRDKNGSFSPSNSLKSDAAHRDFTINAMFLPIDYKSRKDLIDFFGGHRDVKRRILAPVINANERIVESPIRILRALSLASRTKYRIRGDLMSAMRNHVELLKKVPIENIREELNKILLHDKPSRYFKMMHKLGILKIIMPELDMCANVKQDKKYHKYDVFKHCLYTCDHIDPDLVLRLAAILHDIGKPSTRRETKERVTFHKHEVVSGQLSRKLLQRLKYSKEIIKEATHLIRLHMYHYTRDFSDAAVRRFIKRAVIVKDDLDDLGNISLFRLRKAERLGNGYKTIPVTERQLDFEKRIKKVFKATGAFRLEDLDIDGEVVIKVFNMERSPKVGEVLNYLLEKVMPNKKLNNRLDLIKLAAEYIYYKM